MSLMKEKYKQLKPTLDYLSDPVVLAHVVLVNTGEFGGSAAKAPFKLPHHRQIVHSHGSDQISISVFEIDMFSLMFDPPPDPNGEYSRQRKTKPAGIQRHGIS